MRGKFARALAVFMCIPAMACAQQVTTLSFWTASQERADTMMASVEAWNDANPQNMIELQATVFEANLFDEKLWTVLHSGTLFSGQTPPDIVDVEYQDISKYVNPQNSLFYSLDNTGITTSTAREPYYFRNMCFALPVESGEIKAVYNLKALENANMDAETIASWEDFERFAEEYYNKTGKAFWGIDIDHYLSALTLYLLNVEREGSENAYQKTLETLVDMIESGAACLMPGGRIDSRSFREAFDSGEIACAFMRAGDAQAYDAGAYLSRVPQMENESGVWIPGHGICVTVFCRDYMLAMDFLYFAHADTLEPAQGFILPEDVESIIENYKMDLAYMLFS